MTGNVTKREPTQSLMALNEVVTILLDGDDTEGRFALVEQITQPGMGGPFLHTHPAAETFQVLEGTYEFYGQDEQGAKYTITAGPGEVVHVPSNAPHGQRNVGATVGKMLVIFSPAGSMELLFREVGTPIEDKAQPIITEPDFAVLMPAFERYGIVILETPGVS